MFVSLPPIRPQDGGEPLTNATNPNLGGRVLDRFSRPVTNARDDVIEAFDAWNRNRGERVPLEERAVREADEVAGVCIHVVEVEADAVVGEHLGADRHFAEAQPGKDDGAGHDEGEPEGRGAYDCVAESLGGRLVVTDEEDDLCTCR